MGVQGHHALPAGEKNMKRPVIVGLTGSIGMGKSAVGRMFRRLGVAVFDADAAVRVVQGPGGSALEAIEAAFPGTVGMAGVDRAELGRRVFGNRAALTRLERIVHPAVGAMQQRFLRRHRGRRVVVLDIPLLLEGNGRTKCDLVVVVSAPFRVQRARVLARAGVGEAKFLSIMGNQMPDAEKRRRADVVVETGRGRLLTWRTVRAVVRAVG